MNRNPWICETVPNNVIFVSSESQRRGKDCGTERMLQEIIDENFLNIAKDMNLHF